MMGLRKKLKTRISQINGEKHHNQECRTFGPGQQPKKKIEEKAAEIANLERELKD